MCKIIKNICWFYLTNLDVFDTDNVGLWSGAYGWVAVGVDAFEAPGLWCCWNKFKPSKSLLGLSPINCWDTEWERFIIESLSEFEPLLAYMLNRNKQKKKHKWRGCDDEDNFFFFLNDKKCMMWNRTCIQATKTLNIKKKTAYR